MQPVLRHRPHTAGERRRSASRPPWQAQEQRESVKPLSVSLTDEQHAALKRLARERGMSVSALIREAIDDRIRWLVTDEESATPRGRPHAE